MEYYAILVHYFTPRWILSILFKVTESQNKYERHCEEIRHGAKYIFICLHRQSELTWMNLRIRRKWGLVGEQISWAVPRACYPVWQGSY